MGFMSAATSNGVSKASPKTATTNPATIRLAVGLRFPLFRAGVRALVADDRAIDIVGEADSDCALVDLVRESTANIALVCIKVPGPGCREIIRQLRESRPGVGVLVMTMRFSADFGLDALRHGAAGYVSNDREMAEILTAIQTVGSGGRYVPAEIADLLVSELTEPRSAPTRQLSPREGAVLKGIVEGRSHKEIAAELRVSAKSVGTYRSRVLRKLGLRTTVDLVRYAVRREGQL